MTVNVNDKIRKLRPSRRRKAEAREREASLLRDVVYAVADELRAGRGVVVHCQGGTGRTGSVIACTFRLLGMPTEAVLRYMTQVNKARQKYPGWEG